MALCFSLHFESSGDFNGWEISLGTALWVLVASMFAIIIVPVYDSIATAFTQSVRAIGRHRYEARRAHTWYWTRLIQSRQLPQIHTRIHPTRAIRTMHKVPMPPAICLRVPVNACRSLANGSPEPGKRT